MSTFRDEAEARKGPTELYKEHANFPLQAARSALHVTNLGVRDYFHYGKAADDVEEAAPSRPCQASSKGLNGWLLLEEALDHLQTSQ